MPQKQLDYHLPRSDLGRQPPQTLLVLVGRCAERELVAKLLGHPLLQANGCLKVHAGRPLGQAQCRSQLVLWQGLHTYQQTATITLAAGPPFHVAGDLFPASQVEVTNAEIGSIG
jgi:hypothetical protein